MWPIRLPFLLFTVCTIFLLPWLCAILHLSDVPSDSFSPFFPSTAFQNSPAISDFLNKVPKFQHHTKLYSKSSALLVSSLKLSPICWRRKHSSCCMRLLPRQSSAYFHIQSSILSRNGVGAHNPRSIMNRTRGSFMHSAIVRVCLSHTPRKRYWVNMCISDNFYYEHSTCRCTFFRVSSALCSWLAHKHFYVFTQHVHYFHYWKFQNSDSFLVKLPYTEFHQNPFTGSRIAGRQTYEHTRWS